MLCDFVQHDQRDGRRKRCRRCGLPIESDNPPERCRAICPKSPPGAGAFLKQVLARLYFRDDGQCGCADLAQRMDQQGPRWCERHFDRIVAQLRTNADKHGLRLVPTITLQGLVRLAIAYAKSTAASERKRLATLASEQVAAAASSAASSGTSIVTGSLHSTADGEMVIVNELGAGDSHAQPTSS
jgi:hypothetical protein